MTPISLLSPTLLIRNPKQATLTRETVKWKRSSYRESNKKKMKIRNSVAQSNFNLRLRPLHSQNQSKLSSKPSSRNTPMSKLIGSRFMRVRRSILSNILLEMLLSLRLKSQESLGNTTRHMIESTLDTLRTLMLISHFFRLTHLLWRIQFSLVCSNKMLKNKSKSQLSIQLMHCCWHLWLLKKVNSLSIFLLKKKEILLFLINMKRNAWIIWIFSLLMRILISSLKMRRILINSVSKQQLWLRNSKFNQLNHKILKKNLKSGIFQRASRMKLRIWKKKKLHISTFAWILMIK